MRNPIRSSDAQASAYSYEVSRLVEIGLTIEPGELWSYRDMGRQIGRSIDHSVSSVQSALNRLAKQHGAEFRNEKGVGYVRCRDEDIIDRLPLDRRRIRARIKRSTMRASNIKDYESLSNAAKAEFDMHLSVSGALLSMTARKAIAHIRHEVTRDSGKMEVDRVLALFKPGK